MSESLARVLERQVPLDALPRNTPASVRRLLRRCLEKDSWRRLKHMGDARLELADAGAAPETAVPAVSSGSTVLWKIAAAVAALIAVVAVLTRGPNEVGPLEVTRFTIPSATGEHLATYAPVSLSPDGRRLVYAVGDNVSVVGSGRLVLHDMDTGSGSVLASVPTGVGPFFGPDGNAVAFWTPTGGLSRVSLAGGAPTSLVSTSLIANGGSWAEDGTIVSAFDWGRPLYLTEPGELEIRPLTELDVTSGEGGHLHPQILPGNGAVLFTVWTGAESWDESRLAVADLETGSHRVVLDRGVHGRYTASGHLVFWRGNALMAAPFDLGSLTVRGEPVAVVEGIRLTGGNGSAHFSVSDTGTLAYVAGGLDFFSESVVTDREGQELLRLDERVAVGHPVFSPSGQHVALTIHHGGVYHVGVYDLERGILTTVASTGDNLEPAWTSDGTRITYLSNREGDYSHYTVAADGSGQPQALLPEPHGSCCGNRAAWSPDGEHVIYPSRAGDQAADMDLWVLSASSDSPAEPLVADAGDQSMPAFSPNGRFIVYESTESGANEIWVRPFPAVGQGKNQVSQAGGTRPVWSRDGTEILYATERGIMRVAAQDAGTASMPRLGRPELALEMSGIRAFDVSPDGERFAISRFPEETAAREIHVVLNWTEELKRLVPTN